MSVRTYLKRVAFAFGGVIGAVVILIALEKYAGIPFDTSYRAGCAIVCLGFVSKLYMDYPTERWPKISFIGSTIVNVSIFFTPLASRPASRGELLVFALPDVVVVLSTLIAFYKVESVHQRAVRQQMILGLIIALGFGAVLFTLISIGPHPQRLR